MRHANAAYAFAFAIAAIATTSTLAACKDPPKETGSEPAKDAGAQPAALALKHVKLLHQEAVIEKRVSTDELAALLKSASAAVIAYDAAHPNALPADLDLLVVARPNAVRFWLVSATGDVAPPGLDEAFAKIAKPNVKEGNVAAVQTMTRIGTFAAPRDPYLPSGWRYAADQYGTDVDRVIDTVWPRQ